eukprot:4612910-Alexandrium_andersonii.AAC.1
MMPCAPCAAPMRGAQFLRVGARRVQACASSVLHEEACLGDDLATEAQRTCATRGRMCSGGASAKGARRGGCAKAVILTSVFANCLWQVCACVCVCVCAQTAGAKCVCVSKPLVP